jgi:hypothetical protein
MTYTHYPKRQKTHTFKHLNTAPSQESADKDHTSNLHLLAYIALLQTKNPNKIQNSEKTQEPNTYVCKFILNRTPSQFCNQKFLLGVERGWTLFCTLFYRYCRQEIVPRCGCSRVSWLGLEFQISCDRTHRYNIIIHLHCLLPWLTFKTLVMVVHFFLNIIK